MPLCRGPPLTAARLFGVAEKLDEILAAAEPALRADIVEADSRAATVKQRPTSRRITPAEISVRGGAVPGGEGEWRGVVTPRSGWEVGGGGKRDRRPAALQAGGGGYSDGVGRGRGSGGGRWGGRLLSAAGWKSLLLPLQSLFERQGMAAHAGVLAGAEKPHVSLRKGIPRTKSVGKACGDRGGVPHPQGVRPSP